MVTAIVIPVICIYFYWVTVREFKVQNAKWKNFSHVKEEYLVSGRIRSIQSEKKKFYYNKYICVHTLELLSDSRKITAVKKTPLMKGTPELKVNQDDYVFVYGEWRDPEFMISRIEKKKENN